MLDQGRDRVDTVELGAQTEPGMVGGDHVEVLRQALEIGVPQSGAAGRVEDKHRLAGALAEHAGGPEAAVRLPGSWPSRVWAVPRSVSFRVGHVVTSQVRYGANRSRR